MLKDEAAAFKLMREKIRNKVTIPALAALLNMAVDLIEKLP